MSKPHNYKTAGGRFNVNIEVQQKPRISTDVEDKRGLPKTMADPTSKSMVNCIGLKWTPQGIFTLKSNPSDVLKKVEEAQKANPTLKLHHASFYDLDGVSPLVLGFGYRRTEDTAKCPHLKTSDRAGSGTPTDSDSGDFT